jgi:hypothetical protein
MRIIDKNKGSGRRMKSMKGCLSRRLSGLSALSAARAGESPISSTVLRVLAFTLFSNRLPVGSGRIGVISLSLSLS